MPYADKKDAKTYARKHYALHPERYAASARAWNKRATRANRAAIIAYLSENPCVDCGESDPVVLEFDHVRGVKHRPIADMVKSYFTWKTIEAEIAKCEVRCANCHRRKTAKQFGHYKTRGN